MYKSLKLLSLLASGLAAVGCQEFDGGFDADAIKHAEYANNFEKTYGSIKDIPTWDFSSYNLRQMGLAGGPSYSSITRAGVRPANYTGTVTGATVGYGIIKDQITEGINISSYGDYYSVPQGTLDWLNNHLPEGVQTPLNVTKGNPFVLGVPESDFAIIPIYQGHAGMCWDLHLVANDGSGLKDYKIWSKSQGIKHDLDFSKTNGEEFNYDVKPFDEGGYVTYWGDGDGNSGIARIHFKNGADNHFAFPGVDSRTGKGSNGDYVQVWFQLPAGATITGYFAAIDGEGNETEIWGKTGEDYTTFGNTSSTDEQWCCYDLIASPENKWNNGNFNELTWHNMGTNKCQFNAWEDDRVRIYTRYNYQYTKKLDDPIWDTSNLTGNTVNCTGVGAKPILIDHDKIKSDFFLYLKITAADPDNSAYASVNDCQRSDEGMMVALPLDKPTNIDNGKEYMIIGCEDSANPDVSDWDVNDIVFLLVGQGSLPKVKEVIAEKRYMIEDLGSTFDFDFNDIVVDVSQSATKNSLGQYVKEDGTVYTESEVSNGEHLKSTAVIRHLCGTIPFQIKIGSTNFDVLPGKVNCNPALDPAYSGKYEMANVDWNPNTNNITVTVWPTKAGESGDSWSDSEKNNFLGLYSEQSETFGFPESGEFPYIIACNQDVNWMDECVSVPVSWFKTWPQSYYDYNNGITPGGSGDETPTTVDLPNDKLGDGWGNINKANFPTVSFTQNWSGCQWWYTDADFSEYSKVVVTYTRNSGSESLPLQLVVEYTTENGKNDKGETIYQQSLSGLETNGSTLEVTLSNDYKSHVRQIFIQNGEGTGSITVTRAYAEK